MSHHPSQQRRPLAPAPMPSHPATMPRRPSPASSTTTAATGPTLLAPHPNLPQPIANATPVSASHPDPGGRILSQKRPKKERACDRCRQKKIRCDYSQKRAELSCSSCRVYDTTCTFNEGARKRGPSKGYVQALESRLQRMEALLTDIATSGRISAETVRQLLEEENTSLPTLASAEKREEEEQRQQQNSQEKEQPVATSSSSSPPKPSKIPAPEYSYFGSSSGAYFVTKYFPNLILKETPQILPVTGGDDDVMLWRDDVMVWRQAQQGMYVENTGAGSINWSLPPKEIVDRLVELYFAKLNTLMPILDETEFLTSYRKGYDAVCLPLLAAICRGASRLLEDDDPLVKKYGIDRRQLFVSLDRQFEEDHVIDFWTPKIESVQILLVLAFSAEKWAPGSRDWVGVSLAVKMAQDLGLHRSRSKQQVAPHLIEPYKRLWWTAYIMDRWICAALGRPLIISDADCDIELPVVQHQGKGYDFLTQLIKLSGILGDILRVLYAPRARLVGDIRGMNHICSNLDRALTEWQNGLPAHLKLSDEDLQMIEAGKISDELSTRLNNGAGQLRLTRNSVLLLLRPPFFSHGGHSYIPTEVFDTAKEIMLLFQALDISTFVVCSWTLISYIYLQALCILLLCQRDGNAEIASGAAHSLMICKMQCRRLESYIPERSIVTFIEILEKIIAEDKLKQ